jgi:NADH:ubiquinone oxidoreductase subunit
MMFEHNQYEDSKKSMEEMKVPPLGNKWVRFHAQESNQEANLLARQWERE